MSKKQIAIYMRISTISQGFEAQENILRTWMDSMSLSRDEVVFYKDVGSGKISALPAMERLRQNIAQGLIKKVVCSHFDRLGRSLLGLTGLFKLLSDQEVSLYSVKGGEFDLTSASGRFMANILAATASYELEIKKERQQAGISAAKANGKKWGGSAKGRRLKITEELETQIWLSYKDGDSVSYIARKYGVCRPSVYKIIEQKACLEF
jgi:DNA invertase Pin-like site-specific DNA recombinase